MTGYPLLVLVTRYPIVFLSYVTAVHILDGDALHWRSFCVVLGVAWGVGGSVLLCKVLYSQQLIENL